MDKDLKKPIVLRIAGDKKGRKSSHFVTKAESSAKQNGNFIFSFNRTLVFKVSEK